MGSAAAFGRDGARVRLTKGVFWKSIGADLDRGRRDDFVERVTDASSDTSAKTELRGPVLDVVKELLAGGYEEQVVAVVAKLVARNEELERLISKLRESKNRGEHISVDQLDLFLNKLREAAGGALAEADQKLATAAKEHGERPEEPKPAKQPALRRPPPPNARRGREQDLGGRERPTVSAMPVRAHLHRLRDDRGRRSHPRGGHLSPRHA